MFRSAGSHFPLFIFSAGLLLCIETAATSELGRLTDNLLRTYNVDVRPVINYKDSTLIDLDFYPTHVTELDERTGILTLETVIFMNWKDENLQWNPEEYGGIKEIRIDEKRLWKPDIMPFERRGSKEPHWFPVNLIVNNTGNVFWVSLGTLELICGILDYSNYPQDTQSCQITLGSWSFNKNDIDLHSSLANHSFEDSVPRNPVWRNAKLTYKRIEQHYADDPVPYVHLMFNLEIQRQGDKNCFLDYLPSYVARLLVLCMFWTPDPTRKSIFACAALLILTFTVSSILRDAPSPAAASAALTTVNYTMIVSIAAVLVELIIAVIPRCKFGAPSCLDKIASTSFYGIITLCSRTSIVPENVNGFGQDLVQNDKKRNSWEVLANILEISAFIVFSILMVAI